MPAEKNSALVVLAAHALLPAKWEPALIDELDAIPPLIDLSGNQPDRLGAELVAADAALKKARQLKGLDFGQFRIRYTPDFMSTPILDQIKARSVGQLLDLDVRDAVYRRDMAQAWESHQALLNAARSIGDEPFLASMFLIRMTLGKIGVRSLERALAHEEMRPEHLACAAAGLAAERFRMREGRWPRSLEEMVQAGLLIREPIDLFDGKPLRFRHTVNGLVIYSIGQQGAYDGKGLDEVNTFDPRANRIEFRLWDLGNRRQQIGVKHM